MNLKVLKHLAIVLMAVLAVSQACMAEYSYAETPEGAASSVNTEVQAANESQDDQGKKYLIGSNDLPKAEAIKTYGTYKGRNARRIPVITYHRVVSDAQKRKGSIRGNNLYISQSNFSKQMKWLSRNGYRTISCQEFLLWFDGKIKLPKKSVLITFDDSRACLPKYAYPALKKYGLKATVFTIGHGVVNNEKGSIKKKDLKRLIKKYPNIEYQSHTYALHKHYSTRGMYKRIKKDAAKQAKYFAFDYIAYPYGYSTGEMRKAYKDAGMKMGFSYGDFGYATRSQKRYQIRRIKIYGNGSMSQFTRWFR